VGGSDAGAAFDSLQDRGIFVLPLGSLASHVFLVPVEMRFKQVSAGALVEGVARFHGLEVKWWKAGITVAVFQRGAPNEEVTRALADLTSTNAATRTEAAWRCGWIEDASVMPALLAATKDEDRWVSLQALRSVSKLGWPAAVFFSPGEAAGLLDRMGDLRYVIPGIAWNILAATRPAESLGLFGKAVDQGDSDALPALGRIPGEKSEALLEKALRSGQDSLSMQQAVRGLGVRGGERAFGLLTDALKTPATHDSALVTLARVWRERSLPIVEAELRSLRSAAAFAALGQIGGEEALGLCAAALRDANPDNRRAAVDAIGRIGGAEALTLLKSEYHDSAVEVRETVVSSLAEIGGGDAQDLVIAAADGPQRPGGRAADALCRLASDRATGKLADLLLRAGEAPFAAEALRRIGNKRALEILGDGLGIPDPNARRSVVRAIGQIGGRQAAVLLARAAGDPDRDVIRAVVEAAARIGGTDAVGLLDSLRAHRDAGVRSSVASGLGVVSGPIAVGMLGSMLLDPAPEVRAAAVYALVTAGLPQSVPLIGKASGDPDAGVRGRAWEGIGKIGGAEAIAFVDTLLNSSPQAAVSVLWYFDVRQAAPLWARALTNTSAAVRDSTVDAIKELGAEREGTLLALLVSDSDSKVRTQAFLSIARIDNPAAADTIGELLVDAKQETRALAFQALAGMSGAMVARALEKGVALDRDALVDLVHRYGNEQTSVALAMAARQDPADLMRAVEAGDTPGVRELLARGANVHARYASAGHNAAETILMEAASRGYLDVVKTLVQNGAQVEAGDSLGMTALSYAVLSTNGNGCAQYLSGLGASTRVPVVTRDGLKSSVLSYCAFTGQLDIVRLAIEQGADVNARSSEGITPLMNAAGGGHEEVVGLLLDHGADYRALDSSGKGVVARAVAADRLEIVDLLVSYAGKRDGPRVLADALQLAGSSGKVDIIDALLSRGITPEWHDFGRADSMVTAAAAGRLDAIRALLRRGMRADSPDADGTTPLAAACERGQTHVVRYLLQIGARVNARDIAGRTPLMRAADARQAEVVRLLLQSRADPAAVDRDGKTAMDYAGTQEIKDLLSAGP
jgi:ankyrin repeat protein/HEAT repeat protein